MSRTLRFLLLLGAFGAFVSHGASVDPAVQRIERAAETKLQEQLLRALGSGASLSVAVRMVRATTVPKKKATKGASNLQDLAYLPVPLDLSNPPAANATDPGTTEASVEIAKAFVDLYVGAELPETVIESAKTIIENGLRGYAVELQVHKVRPAPTAETPPPQPLIPPFPSLIGPALLIAFGMLLLGVLLFFAIHRLMLGLGETMERLAPPAPPPTQLTAVNGKDEEETPALPKTPVALPAAIVEGSIARNLEIVEQTLNETPRLFVFALEAQNNNDGGLRWLLPRLTNESREALRRFLRPGLLGQMEKDVSTPTDDDDSLSWLQSLVQRITIRRLQNGESIDAILGAERVARLMRIPAATLMEAALKAAPNEAPYAWRLLTDLLRADDLERGLARLGENQWSALASAHRVDPKHLPMYADHLLQRLSPSRDGGSDASRRDFAMTRLAEPLLQVITRLEPGADDRYLESMAPHFPELLERVEEHVWTPRMLTRVPNPLLEAAYRACPNEQKSALIALLPEPHSSRLRGFLPPGNARTVVVDDAKRTAATKGRDREKAIALVRDFLDKLRRQAAEGKFALQPPSPVVEVSKGRAA